MTNEPLIAPAETQLRLVETADHSTQPEPSAAQQQVSDDVFSREQEQAIAALLAMQVAVGLLHNCAVEAFRPEAEPARPLPRKKERAEEER